MKILEGELAELKIKIEKNNYNKNKNNNNRYELITELASGANGTIYLANENTSLRVIKMQKLDSSYLRKSYKIESKIEEKIQGHPNIIQNLNRFKVTHKGVKYGLVVMEKMDGDLMDYLLASDSLMPEEQVKFIFIQICQAIYHLHVNHKLVHLDIKPDNILIRKSLETGKIDKVKLCDFGFAQKKTWKVKENFGTEKYLPPECNSPYTSFPLDSSIQLEKIDIWSLGVTLFCTLTGYYPYSRNKRGEATRKVSQEMIKKHCKNQLCCDLVLCMLQELPENRPSILEVLHHPWLSSSLPTSLSSSLNYSIYNSSSNNNTTKNSKKNSKKFSKKLKLPQFVKN